MPHSQNSTSNTGQSPGITAAEKTEFLREMVRLQLWFIWNWLATHPEEEFSHVIRNRVDIFRKTDLNKGLSKNTKTPGNMALPDWLKLEEQARAIYKKNLHTSADDFEEQAWQVFRPAVEARTERDLHEGSGMDKYTCGSLRYDILPKRISYYLNFLGYLKNGKPRRISIHISNALAPKSIFDDPLHLPNCFLQLMEETRKKYRATALTTATWLNDYPPWLALFPKQWHDNLTPLEEGISWSQLYWGQFVTARGTFNFKHAKIFRETGKMPYTPQRSWCSYNNLQHHLHEYIKEHQDKNNG